MSSPGSNVDSAENLNRWRAIMTGTFGVPETPSPSSIESLPGNPESTASIPPGPSVGIPDGDELPLQSVHGRDSASAPRSRAGSLEDDQLRTAIHNSIQASIGTSSATTSALGVPDESGAKVTITDDLNGSTPHHSQPINILSATHDSERTPTQTPISSSYSSHPLPSPSVSGLRAPANSPQVHASTPQFAPGNTHDEDVGAALSWFVQNLSGGRSLDESIWAPKNGRYAPSPLRGSRVPSSSSNPIGASGSRASSTELTPVNIVQPNPAINDSFSRMTFRAADSDHGVSGNIIGERNSRFFCKPFTLEFIFFSWKPRDCKHVSVSRTSTQRRHFIRLSDADAGLPPMGIRDGFIVTDFATKNAEVSSSAPQTAGIPPHLRGKVEAPKMGGRSHEGPSEDVKEAPEEDLTKTVDVPSEISSFPSPVAPEARLSLQPEITRHDSIPEVGEAVPSLAEINQKLLRTIVEIESDGCLSAEALALFYATHEEIQAHIARTSRNVTDDHLLPAKTYKVSTRPFQKHSVEANIPTKTENQVTDKATVQNPSTVPIGAPDSLVRDCSPRPGPDIPTSSYRSASCGSIDFRKTLAATSSITASICPDAEELAPAADTKAPTYTPSTIDIVGLPPPPLEGASALVLDTAIGAKATAVNPTEESKRVPSLLSLPSLAEKTTGMKANTKDMGDRQDQIYFASWGKREQRDRPPARVRTVIISKLPCNATSSFVTSLVYGGAVEFIQMRSSADGALTATVRFMDADACKQYYDKTSNGVVYSKDTQNREMVAFVELAKDVEVVGGMLQQSIDNGVTRCVRAVGVDEDWGIEGLTKMAERKGRKLEGLSDSKSPGGARSVVFRFCKIEDAVQFKSGLVRDEDWEYCNIHFAADPCAAATDVHFND